MKFTTDDLGGLNLKLGHRALQFLMLCVPPYQPDAPIRVMLDQFKDQIGVDFYEIEPAFRKAKILRKSRRPRFAEGYSDYYFLSNKAVVMAKGNPLKRMNRSQLEALWVKVQKKIKEVQTDNRFIYEFAFIALMGSYMENKQDYGDLDIAYWMRIKEQFKDWPSQRLLRHHFTHWPGDHRFWNHWQSILWSKPRRYVKSASPQRVDFVTFDDFIMLQERNPNMPHKILFGDIGECAHDWLETERNDKLKLIGFG